MNTQFIFRNFKTATTYYGGKKLIIIIAYTNFQAKYFFKAVKTAFDMVADLLLLQNSTP